MATIEYSLFRAKMIRPTQQLLFADDLSPRDAFEQALNQRPSAELGGERTWHVGNIEQFDRDTGYFAFGKTSKTINTTFDDLRKFQNPFKMVNMQARWTKL